MSHTLHQQLVELSGQAEAWLEGEKPEGFEPMLGICQNLPRKDDLLCDLLRDLTATWPAGTGDRFECSYPG